MKRPRYAEYRDSGVDWLGEVPAHWGVDRLKWSVEGCVNGIWGAEADGGDDDLVCARVADFDRIALRVDISAPTLRAITPSERNSRLLRRGDLLLEKSGGGALQPVGAVVQFDHDIAAVTSNFVARMRVNEDYDSRFLAYLHAHLYAGRVNIRSIKQTTGIQNLDSQAYLDERVCYPPLDEQRAIAAFLDRETTRIDALIATKRRFLALLAEKRAALISHAVTCGLDPDVPLKESGVQWFARIPAHWQIMPMKRRLQWVTSGSRGWAAHYSDEGSLFIRIGNLTRTGIDLDLSDVQFVDPPENSEGERTAVEPGDLLLSITAFLGSVAVVTDVGQAYVSQHVALARPISQIVDSRWLAYCLFSDAGKRQMETAGYGGTKVQLGLDDVKEIVVPIPPRQEQEQIAHFLDEQTADLGEGKRAAEAMIECLSEYRHALVMSAVTGRWDVGAAA